MSVVCIACYVSLSVVDFTLSLCVYIHNTFTLPTTDRDRQRQSEINTDTEKKKENKRHRERETERQRELMCVGHKAWHTCSLAFL